MRTARFGIACMAVAVVLLTGCTGAPQATGFPAQQVAVQVPETPSYPGLHVDGNLSGSGAQVAVDATATNAGPRTYHVETGCTTPWTEQLSRGSESLVIRQPMAVCQSYALRDLPPNGTVSRTFTWDGTVWSEGRHGFVHVGPGSYTWSIRFVAYSPDGAALKRFDLDFPVAVA